MLTAFKRSTRILVKTCFGITGPLPCSDKGQNAILIFREVSQARKRTREYYTHFSFAVARESEN